MGRLKRPDSFLAIEFEWHFQKGEDAGRSRRSTGRWTDAAGDENKGASR
jgi:hypothetical protein